MQWQDMSGKAWLLEKNLSPIEIPDQAGYVEKLACQECLAKVMVNPER